MSNINKKKSGYFFMLGHIFDNYGPLMASLSVYLSVALFLWRSDSLRLSL